MESAQETHLGTVELVGLVVGHLAQVAVEQSDVVSKACVNPLSTDTA